MRRRITPAPLPGSRTIISSTAAFLDEGQLLRDRHRIEHIPAVIVQGRYDMVCPPASAWELAEGWDRAELRLVPASGHALSEPRIAAELVRVMDGLRDAAQEDGRA